jgi:outer membrane protein assembly factor BamB
MASRQGGGRLVVHCVLVALALSGACGAARVAVAGELIASPEPDWPQWRGPRRDAVSTETGLLDAWPQGGPKLLWKRAGMGKGWCSPIITRGTLYIGGDVSQRLQVFALDLDGKIKWQVPNGQAWKRPFPGSRASCAYSEGKLYQMNGHGRVVCLDAATGKEQWAVEVLKRFGAKQPRFGMSECLLVDGNNVIVTPAGAKALIAALDKKTGQTVWTGAAPLEATEATETAGYSSPILVTLGGRRQIIATTSFRTFAADAATGKVLWTAGLTLTKNACSTIPVLCGDSLFISNTSVDDQSSHMLRVSPSGDKASKAWTLPLRNLSGSGVHVDGKLYISAARKLKGYLCLDPKTGKTTASLPAPLTAAGVWADGKLYLQSDDGKVLMLKPTAAGFQTLGAFPVVPPVKGKDAWAHPVLCNGRLYLRYHDTLFCYDVKGQ